MAEMGAKIGEVCWTELSTTNVPAAKEFYSNVFGWKFSDHDMGDTTYTMIEMDGKGFGGIWQIPKEMEKQIPPHWISYILVEDAEESLEEAKNFGAKVIKPVTKAGDFGLFAIIQDPVGAHIALWQTLKKK